tara:strand:- start:513 stop:662 length:150 start_codon:yes stop_codon:yes gene_type:complete
MGNINNSYNLWMLGDGINKGTGVLEGWILKKCFRVAMRRVRATLSFQKL